MGRLMNVWRMWFKDVPLWVQQMWRISKAWLKHFPKRKFAPGELLAVFVAFTLILGFGYVWYRLFVTPAATPALPPPATNTPPPTATMMPPPTPTSTSTPTLTPKPPPTSTPTNTPPPTPTRQWAWCWGCENAELWIEGKKAASNILYFPSGVTIFSPVGGELILVEIISDQFKIEVNGKQMSTNYYSIVYIRLGNDNRLKNKNTLYSVEVLSTDLPEMLGREGDRVKPEDPLMKINNGEGVAACHKYDEDNHKWIPCKEGE